MKEILQLHPEFMQELPTDTFQQRDGRFELNLEFFRTKFQESASGYSLVVNEWLWPSGTSMACQVLQQVKAPSRIYSAVPSHGPGGRP